MIQGSASDARQLRANRIASANRLRARGAFNRRRLPFLALSILALLAALWAGLLRLGWSVPAIQPGLYAAHGPLMVCGFLGTLISLERAVAIGRRWCYAAPLLSGTGALALILGIPDPVAPLLITFGSIGLVAIFIAIILLQPALFTITMALGAVAWFAGNSLWLMHTPVMRIFAWWVGFLVLTIVGERLELSRLTGLGEKSRHLFIAGTGLFLAGLILGMHAPALGLRLSGLGMLAMALWLWRHDIAVRTVKQRQLTRFIAINLLAGYFWLGAGGVAWIIFGGDLTTFHYDVMLHAIFLGFVFSMIFAHAPVIFPAVLQGPLLYRPSFYLHTVLLHVSLVIRIGGAIAASYTAYRWGGLLNVIAVLAFVGNTAYGIGSEILRKNKNAAPGPADALYKVRG